VANSVFSHIDSLPTCICKLFSTKLAKIKTETLDTKNEVFTGQETIKVIAVFIGLRDVQID